MNNTLLVIIIGVVIISVFIAHISSKEEYSYSFNFPTHGSFENRLRGIDTPYFDYYRTNPFVGGNYPYGYPYNYNYDYPREIITQPLITPPFYPQSILQPQTVIAQEIDPFIYNHGYNSVPYLYDSFGPTLL